MNYKLIIEQLKSLAEISNDYLPLLANTSALLNENK